MPKLEHSFQLLTELILIAFVVERHAGDMILVAFYIKCHIVSFKAFEEIFFPLVFAFEVSTLWLDKYSYPILREMDTIINLLVNILAGLVVYYLTNWQGDKK